MRINIGNTFEKDVYELISKCLGEDEKIEFGKDFDFYLPNGVKKLGWEKNTAVEVKYQLIYDSLSRLKYYYEKVKPDRLIVVVIHEIAPLINLHNNIKDSNITFKLYQELQEAATKAYDENTIQQTKRRENNKKAKEADKIYINDINANIIERAKEALKKDKVSLFLGAGVSASAGIITWNGLLEQLCVKKGLSKIDTDIDSIIKGRYIIDEYINDKRELPDDFYLDMRNILYANIHSSRLIKSIAKLITTINIESIISYNYDNIVELEVGNLCQPVYNKSRPIDGANFHIYHVHGYIPREGEWSPIVLGEREYHKIYQESYNWGNVEQLHALCRSTCFFIGLSMTDPNLRRLIDISIDGSEKEPVHYAFLRRIEYDVNFMEKTMRGLGVNCIWYDRYEELPVLLDSLNH